MFTATILTLYPEMFPGPLGHSLTGRALAEGKWSLNVLNIRDFTTDKHRTVDDTPYGGGAGMVLRPDVLDAAISHVKSIAPEAQLIYLSPRGTPFTQAMAHAFTQPSGYGLRHSDALLDADLGHNLPPPSPPPEGRGKMDGCPEGVGTMNDPTKHQALSTRHLLILCGRFEGVDERVLRHHDALEISLGDFVLCGGEVAAMAVLEACVRLLPGVIGDAESLAEESFGNSENYAGLLEYPHYTKPPLWKGHSVPEVLTSGNHAEIARWRLRQAEAETEARRPDLWHARKALRQKQKE